MTDYPTKWKRSTMRGCGPVCERMDLPVESRLTSKTTIQHRHIHSKGDVLALLDERSVAVDTGKHTTRTGWWATGLPTRRASSRRTVDGATEREALQNLAEELGVRF